MIGYLILDEDILDTGDELTESITDETIAPQSRVTSDISRYDIDISISLQCESCRDESTRIFSCLSDECAPTHTGDKLVSYREIVGFWLCPEWEMRYDSSTICNYLVK